MDVFVSSLITGMEPYRAAARKIVVNLRHEPIMAEDFGARPQTPQVACLTEVRRADVVVLLIGERYGAVQQSGWSATHEEYLAVRGEKPVIVFVQSGVTREAQQDAFYKEVGEWQNGELFGTFETPDDLERVLTRALMDYERSQAGLPINESELRDRCLALLPDVRKTNTRKSVAVALAGGPKRQILRPTEIEEPSLIEDLHREALFGAKAVFDHRFGVDRKIETGALLLSQRSDEGLIRVDACGDLLVQASLRDDDPHAFPCIIEEDVEHRLAQALSYAAWALDRIDPTFKLTHLAIGAHLDAANYLSWRTRAEHDRKTHSVPIGRGEAQHLWIVKPRAALRFEGAKLVEDFVVQMRRQRREP